MARFDPLVLLCLCLSPSLLQFVSTFSQTFSAPAPSLCLRSCKITHPRCFRAASLLLPRGRVGLVTLRAADDMQDTLKSLDKRNIGDETDDGGMGEVAWRLWDAAQDGDVEGIQKALKEGVDVNIQQGDEHLSRTGLGSAANAHLGPTALHLASMFGKVAAVEELLKNSASPNIVDMEGNSPLHMAVINNRAEVVELLVKAGADVNIKNEFEETPKDMANMMGRNMPSLN